MAEVVLLRLVLRGQGWFGIYNQQQCLVSTSAPAATFNRELQREARLGLHKQVVTPYQ